MAYDAGLAQVIRDAIEVPVREQKMFGGLAFMVSGHMVAGIHKGGAMIRVGKANEAAALAVNGTRPMEMAGRPMPGMISADDDCMVDDVRRSQLIGMALAFVRALPPK